MHFRARSYQFDLSNRVLLMGVINVTPDSFSDGGQYFRADQALRRAVELAEEGADILDLGAVSTRPGAGIISEEEEWNRLETALKKILKTVSLAVSVDTTSSRVAEKALILGAHIVNDVSGLKQDPRMAKVVSDFEAGIILMHRRGNPETMQDMVCYQDVICEVKKELEESIRIAKANKIREDSIVIDPGIGFAKTADQSLEILKRLSEFQDLGYPVMVGPSRKSFIGHVLDRDVHHREAGTIASCVLAVSQGARILRVHEVRAVKEAALMAMAISPPGSLLPGRIRPLAEK